MEIKVRFTGLEKVKNQIRQKEARLDDLTPFWQSVGMLMIKKTMKCFEQEQSPDGIKWKPLSEARIRQREKRHKGGRMKILTDTGELRRSITYTAFKSRVIFGSALTYAAIHQFGGEVIARKKGTYKRNYGPSKPKGGSYSYQWTIRIPARPYLGVTDEDKRQVISMMRNYLMRR